MLNLKNSFLRCIQLPVCVLNPDLECSWVGRSSFPHHHLLKAAPPSPKTATKGVGVVLETLLNGISCAIEVGKGDTFDTWKVALSGNEAPLAQVLVCLLLDRRACFSVLHLPRGGGHQLC